MSKIFIIGCSSFAKLMLGYFETDSKFEVVGFSVERAYIKEDRFCGRAVVPFEDVEKYYSPDEFLFLAAIGYSAMNSVREKFYIQAKEKGYRPVSYISSHALILPGSYIGEHACILERTIVQPGARVGNNVIIWGGSYIAHDSSVEDNCFLSFHVAVAGNSKIGRNCFLGVNSTVIDSVTVGNNSIIGAGAVANFSVPENSVLRPARSVLFGDSREVVL